MRCPPITYVCKAPENGDAHWRVVRPAVRLQEAGVDVRISWLDDDEMPTEPVAGRVVVLHQVIVNTGAEEARAWVGRLKSAGALAVVYETDDDEWTGSNIDHLAATHLISTVERAEHERCRLARLDLLRACNGATVSIGPLADVVRRYTDAPVITVPNAIDVDWFRARLPERAPWADYTTIGWAGWRRPDADLEPMAVAWGRIAARYPDVRFVVAGHQADVIYRQPIDLDRIIRVPIAPLDEYPAMHQVDIGCCAVADSPFNRCKTPIKAWEFALAGAAVVATPTLYGECVKWKNCRPPVTGWAQASDGITIGPPVLGLLAQTADQWEERLSMLIRRWDIRQALRHQLLDHVEQQHSLTANLHRWTDAYAEIVASVGVPA